MLQNIAISCHIFSDFCFMVKQIIIEHLLHRNEMRVFIRFEIDHESAQLVKQALQAQWSATQRAWHVPYEANMHERICKLFAPYGARVFQKNNYQTNTEIIKLEDQKVSTEQMGLNTEGIKKMTEFKYWLQSRRYSDHTVHTYTEALAVFLKYYQAKAIADITNEDLIYFNNNYILAKQLSASYQNQIVNAIKLFFVKIEFKKMEVNLIHRPKTPKLLPNVLSKEEVKLILNAHGNIKHKAMLSLIYSCGLRCGELLRLKLADVDAKRNVLIIKQAKGRKDRIAPLSEKTIELLRTYYTAYKPQTYLFEGQIKNEAYDDRSLQAVIKQAIAKVGITKPVSLHWLRHSYATHLLEAGTDLRYIQEILGHSSSRTTEIYTHVSTKSIQNVVSPFDSL